MLKDDMYYISKIYQNAEFILEHMKEVSKDDLQNNEILLDSMMLRLVQISENAKNLSEEYQEKHSIIPWTSIYGLRNRIVHDYGNVDISIIYETLTNDISQIVEMLK